MHQSFAAECRSVWSTVLGLVQPFQTDTSERSAYAGKNCKKSNSKSSSLVVTSRKRTRSASMTTESSSRFRGGQSRLPCLGKRRGIGAAAAAQDQSQLAGQINRSLGNPIARPVRAVDPSQAQPRQPRRILQSGHARGANLPAASGLAAGNGGQGSGTGRKKKKSREPRQTARFEASPAIRSARNSSNGRTLQRRWLQRQRLQRNGGRQEAQAAERSRQFVGPWTSYRVAKRQCRGRSASTFLSGQWHGAYYNDTPSPRRSNATIAATRPPRSLLHEDLFSWPRSRKRPASWASSRVVKGDKEVMPNTDRRKPNGHPSRL